VERVTSPARLARLRSGWLSRPEFVYSLALFLTSLGTLVFVLQRAQPIPDLDPGTALFFLLFGLFTINMGYHDPHLGYVSFDRVAQVSSLLVLGPLHAAWINGLASLLFPWQRLREGAPLRQVITASLNNAGLMTLMILACGTVYFALGGSIRVARLDAPAAVLLALLIVTMQIANEVGLRVHLRLRDGRWPDAVIRFVLGMEFGSGFAAVLVALVFVRMELAVFALLMAVLCAGMLVLRQFARMRIQLEAIVQDRTSVLSQKTLELERLATHDQLTGLFNRRFADEYLDRRIEEFNRYGRPFAIAMVDLDHFKRVNDKQSHVVGDEVLRRIAHVLIDRCRETDMVARYGGEEFLLCFPETNADGAVEICEQLRLAVSGVDWSPLATGIEVSLSAGVAEMRPSLDRSMLLRAADSKLYQAKEAGRNLVFA
jgi:diguanylate cyclase (GGDEF)-like protein